MAQELDFFVVANICGFNFFDASVTNNAAGNGDDVPLVFVAHQEELIVLLANALAGEFKPCVVLFPFEEDGGGGREFDKVVGTGIFGPGRFKEADDFA